MTLAQLSESEILEKVIVQRDLSKLTPSERVIYYNKTCESLGLNPLTGPFDYITLNGKMTLYARKDATDQLRKIHNVSFTKMENKTIDGVYVVTVHAKLPDGREDISTGAVSIANLKGDMLANAFLKAETKAKRRATLSIVGLGMLDETETETIKDAVVGERDITPKPKELLMPTVIGQDEVECVDEFERHITFIGDSDKDNFTECCKLLEEMNVPIKSIEKWCTQANVKTLSEMSDDQLNKIINHLLDKQIKDKES